MLRMANKNAAEFFADRSRTRATQLGGTAKKAAPSIGARAEQRYAKVAFGGSRYPFAAGANFGAQHNTPRYLPRSGRTVRGWNQFPEWGGNQFSGGAKDRYVYWTLWRYRDEFTGEYLKQLDQFLEIFKK